MEPISMMAMLQNEAVLIGFTINASYVLPVFTWFEQSYMKWRKYVLPIVMWFVVKDRVTDFRFVEQQGRFLQWLSAAERFFICALTSTFVELVSSPAEMKWLVHRLCFQAVSHSLVCYHSLTRLKHSPQTPYWWLVLSYLYPSDLPPGHTVKTAF